MTTISAQNIDYKIEYSHKRKTIAIQIHYQQVIIKAPFGVDTHIIHNFVQSKKKWIERKLEEIKPEIAFNQYYENGFVWYMGKKYQIRCNSNQKLIGKLENNYLILKASNNPQLIQKQYLKWLQHQAKRMMPDLVNHCLQRSDKTLFHQVQSITCKRTKSKWGHCTSDQRLQFNWIILMAPAFVLEYLICHEIAHLEEKNHSRKFWGLVEQLCDHTTQAERWLKQNGEVLMQA